MKRLTAETGLAGPGGRFPAVVLVVIAAVCTAAVVTGCKRHMPSPAAPESRGPVKDLAAIRGGDQLWLTWTIPKRGTGKLVVNRSISVRVCRRESLTGPCTAAGEPMMLAPGATGSFSEKLPDQLASGTPRPLYYFVELIDRSGRSTGLSNSVATLAGAPPPAVQDLTAEWMDRGVRLRWMPDSTAEESMGASIRIHRTRLISLPTGASSPAASSAVSDSAGRDMVVEDGAQTQEALDTDIRQGASYEYSAQRVFRITVAGQMLELAGQFSAPADVYLTGAHPR